MNGLLEVTKMRFAALALVFIVCNVGAQGINLNGDPSNAAQAPYSGVGGNGNTLGPNAVGTFGWGIGNFSDGGCFIGRNNYVAINDSCAIGGADLYIAGDNSIGFMWAGKLTGNQSIGYGYGYTDRGTRGAHVFAMGDWNPSNTTPQGSGKAQRRELLVRCISVGTEPCQLSTEPSQANRFTDTIVLPDNASFDIEGKVVATDSASGVSCRWRFEALIKRAQGAASISLVGATASRGFCDAAAQSWNLAIATDQNLGSFALLGDGSAGKTVQWLGEAWSLENVREETVAPPPSDSIVQVPPAESLVGTDGHVYSLGSPSQWGFLLLRDGAPAPGGGECDLLDSRETPFACHNNADQWWAGYPNWRSTQPPG